MTGPDVSLTEALTAAMRTGTQPQDAALRRALVGAGHDPDEVAIADFHSEGSVRSDDGAVAELMWVTMATSSGTAYVGDLVISAETGRLRRLAEVPARPIPESTSLAEQLNENRRRQRPWNTDLPDWVTSPADLLYNREIQSALAWLATDRAPD